MAKTKSRKSASDSGAFLLALGLLLGFVIAFVVLLSRVPVDGFISQPSAAGSHSTLVAEMDFDYYSVLEQQSVQRNVPQPVTVEPPVVFLEPPAQPQQSVLAATEHVTPDQPVVMPETRQTRAVVLPAIVQASVSKVAAADTTANTQRIMARAQTADAYREIRARTAGQDSYYVEAGSFVQNEEAVRVQASLRNLGLEAFIVVRQDNSGGFGHRVRIGPFLEQSRLDDTRNRLRESGISPRLIRVKG